MYKNTTVKGDTKIEKQASNQLTLIEHQGSTQLSVSTSQNVLRYSGLAWVGLIRVENDVTEMFYTYDILTKNDTLIPAGLVLGRSTWSQFNGGKCASYRYPKWSNCVLYQATIQVSDYPFCRSSNGETAMGGSCHSRQMDILPLRKPIWNSNSLTVLWVVALVALFLIIIFRVVLHMFQSRPGM